MPRLNYLFLVRKGLRVRTPWVNSRSIARFSATGVQSTDFSRVSVPLRKAQLKLVL